MKVVQQTATTLVMQDKPWFVWLVGALFVAGGLVAFLSGETKFGGGFVIAGVGLILAFANTVTSTFDRGTGRFRRSLTGLLRHSELAHALDDIAGVSVEASASGHPSRSYRVALELTSRTRVPLTPTYSSGKADKEALATAIREFLKLPAPPPPLPGFTDMVKVMLDPNAVERLGEMLGSGPEARAHLEQARGLARSQGNAALAGQLDLALRKLDAAASGPQQPAGGGGIELRRES
ncbi:MAG: hypothetical protein M3R55_02120 [Acidobacteriota bacterium]|nr:hypothetical protein [Acidobacteriota bacterium]